MVYVEGIIIVDLIIHHVFVYATSLFLLVRIKKYRLLISDILNIILLWLYMYYHISFILQAMMIIAICLITFHKHKIKTSLLYLAFNIMLGGMAEILYLGGILNGYILLILLVILLCLLMIYKIVFKGIKSKNLIYQLIIIENKKKIVLDAYLDTGNFLQDDKNNPVIVVNKRFKNYFKRPYSNVLCQTVNNISYMSTYKFEKGYIKLNNHYKEIEGSIVFSNIAFEGMIGLDIIGGYQCLDL